MVCAHYAEVNNIFSCKRIGDGEHCAHEIYRHQKRKIIAQTSEIIKHQFFSVSFLRVCHFVEDRVCTECICVCVRQTFSALIVGCRVCELCDAMCIHIQLNREITMKLILKIVFSLSLLFHTSKWSPAPSSTQFLI